MTTRREFLTGLFGAAAVAALPASTALAQTSNVEWENYIWGCLQEHMNNLVLYGTSAVKFTAEHPYIEVVGPKGLFK